MLRLFSKKTELDRLKLMYKKKLQEAFKKSSINRREGDLLTAEANALLDKIKLIEEQQNS